MKDRLKAAVLFEIFEESQKLFNNNLQFNEDEHQKYDDKLAELSESNDQMVLGIK